MQRIIFSFLIIIGMVFLSTCTKGTSARNTEKTDTIPLCDSVALINNPLNVKWVQQVIAGRDCQFILNGAQMSTCIYNNKIVVYFENPASNLGTCVAKVYNCNGTILLNGMYGQEWFLFDQNIKNKNIFWAK